MLYLFIVANSNNTMHVRVVENGGQRQHVSGSTSWSPKVVTAAASKWWPWHEAPRWWWHGAERAGWRHTGGMKHLSEQMIAWHGEDELLTKCIKEIGSIFLHLLSPPIKNVSPFASSVGCWSLDIQIWWEQPQEFLNVCEFHHLFYSLCPHMTGHSSI